MSKGAPHHFKTFPEFSKLTIEDKEVFEACVATFPPYASLSFAELMTWWSWLGECKISNLNGNLVIAYWIPGDESRSGLSLVGTKKIDESMCALFDYMKEHEKPPRLVNVPEFVLSHLRYPDMYECITQRDDDECILAIQDYEEVTNMNGVKKVNAMRFIAQIEERNINLKSLDLSLPDNRELLTCAYNAWEGRSPVNILPKISRDSMNAMMKYAAELGVDNCCLFINNELHAFILIEYPADRTYAIAAYGKFSFEIPGLFEYALYKYAQWFKQKNIKYVNIDFDMGDRPFRTTQLALRPVNFLRKYTVRPLTNKHI